MSKKNQFKIRKGLETNLCIQGMEMKYFYIFSFITGGFILLLVGQLMTLSQNISFAGFIRFLVSLLVCFVIVIAMKFFFTRRSEYKGYTFKKIRIYLTNRDILNIL